MFAKRSPSKRPSTTRRQTTRPGGFTLLEAVVALAIFSAGAMALYGLYGANLMGLTRAGDVAGQLPIVEQAVERFSLIDLRQQAEGRFNVGPAEISWTAALVELPRRSQSASGYAGAFEIGLYQVDFDVAEDGRLLGSWQMRLASHERVRDSTAFQQ